MGFGCYYGCVVQSYLFEGQSRMASPESGALWKGILRVIVMIALVLPGGAFYGLNYVGVDSQVFLLIFAQILPQFLVPFTPFAFGDTACLKLGLLEEARPN